LLLLKKSFAGGFRMPRKKGRDEPLQFAALIAHQLRSPVGAAGSLLKTLLGEYAGHLNPKQKDLLARADKRIEEALDAVQRMLAIVRPETSTGDFNALTDAAALVRRVQMHFMEEARGRGIALGADIYMEPAYVRLSESALAEALHALVNNALKYTPDNGKLRLTVAYSSEHASVYISVADSGIGVPEDQRSKIFEPFFRAPTAQNTSLPGVGLGLAFVKALIDAAGGRIWAQKSDLGGAEFSLILPRVDEADLPKDGHPLDSERMKVVIIGGVAAGPKVASKVIRLQSDTLVTIIEKGDLLSYAGCGLPYYVSGIVKEQKELLSTPLGCVRDLVFFQNMKNVVVLNRTEAMEIDRAGKRVRIKNLISSKESWISYDKLVLATGATPVIPPLPGAHLKNIFALHGVRDAEGVRTHLAGKKARDVVIVGGGLIGVEMTEALVARGCRVTIVEQLDQIMRILDWEMAQLLENHMESNGVRVMTGTRVLSFTGAEFVEGVVTDRGTLLADMVILAVGVRPEVSLAQNAGLEIGSTRAIKVDTRMMTSDPDIYAAGDCVENTDVLTGMPCYVPLGSTANKQGRIAAINICGGNEIFPGVLGTTVCKVFDYCVARTGLTENEAAATGYDVVSVLTGSPDREHFMPDSRIIMLKLVVDRSTRRLLGVQAVGPGHGDKRIDIAATAITAGMTVDLIANLDLGYAPPYSLAMDNLITGANIAMNKLGGIFESITPMEVYRKLWSKEDFILLDVSSPQEYEEERLPGSILIPTGTLRSRLKELPRGKEIVTFCRLSIRGYEAALLLKSEGFDRVRVMDGGVLMWPYEKVHGMK
jgi:NADPH-dependent 2,4-dienoyl-CoA reductase/sulfur reductase-like enzyme/rhodanese-related sulfurtransferase/two-component sensor histidine kinase